MCASDSEAVFQHSLALVHSRVAWKIHFQAKTFQELLGNNKKTEINMHGLHTLQYIMHHLLLIYFLSKQVNLVQNTASWRLLF